MLEIEDNQEFVWEIIDEVFDNTLKIIHEKYLNKQTIPYTINEAKKAILHILDVKINNFLYTFFFENNKKNFFIVAISKQRRR